MKTLLQWLVIAGMFGLLCSCVPSQPTMPATVLPTPLVLRATRPVRTPYPTPTRAPTWTPEVTATSPGPLSTPNPFTRYFINSLRSQSFGGGELENLGVFSSNDTFTRYSIRYPSENIKVYGFVNVPFGKGPFPVIIALHGYSNPAGYNTLDYTTGFTDDMASQGYIVVHPNYRNFQPSENGDAAFRVGYAVDVLNLLALVRNNAGQPGLFEHANPDRIGLWGHSMGGAIALKVAVVSPYLKAVVLYAPMSGDEQKNSKFFNFTVGGRAFQTEMNASAADFTAISAETYYKNITAPIQIHHGTGDTTIPVSWSKDTCQKLKDAGVLAECYYYDGAGHTFRAVFIPEYGKHVDDFFARYLK